MSGDMLTRSHGGLGQCLVNDWVDGEINIRDRGCSSVVVTVLPTVLYSSGPCPQM